MGASRSDYFPIHAHSQYSVLDGMGTVQEMVERVAKLGQPALALTDHGTLAGTLRLYKECQKAGLAPFPGIEAYLVMDCDDEDARNERFHLGMLALNYNGFRALVQMSSKSYRRERFHKRPLIDLDDLAHLSNIAGNDIAITTGCYFGWVVQMLTTKGERAARAVIEKLVKWFPHTFVEVQYHGVTHDDGTDDGNLSVDIISIADRLGLPVVLGQDSHYCEAIYQPVHDLMKEIGYFGDGEDNSFPGGPYHLAGTKWLKKPWRDDQWDRIEEGHAALLDLNNVSLPALDKYKFHVPKVLEHPMVELKRQVNNAMASRGLDLWEHYERRVKRELHVIEEMGMANYFLVVWDIVDWCRKQGIFVDARGSANGSLVCYVLGITTVDPIEWDTDFDRFLSTDRKKPPDIDLDVEHERRDEVIAYVMSKHPGTVQIGTYGRLGITEDPDGEDKGSVYVQYAAAMRKKQGAYTGIADEHRPLLEAMAVIPIRKGAGRHAGGFVLPGEGLAIEDYLATMTIGQPGSKERKDVATQAVMEDVEECGYLKLDILGLKMLSTFRRCVEAIGKDPVKDGMTWIPNNDNQACKVLRSGIVGNGVFQFEGYTTAEGAKRMQVRTTQEGIFCITLFRPAVMDGGQTDRFLAARDARQPEQALHSSLWPIVKDTWGVPIFQDQIMEIMKAVGLDFDDWNDILKAVKASNDKIVEYANSTFGRVHPLFVQKAIVNNGMTKEEAEYAWSEVVGFSDYGFNRAHGTNYGLRGYRMAFLKAHHPTKFMAATLATWAGTDKEPKYIREARRMKMQIARADVNTSDVVWSVDGPMKLRKGLTSIKGIGLHVAEAVVEEREKNGPYVDTDDFCARLPARPVSGVNDLPGGTLKGVCKTLVEASAMKSLGWDPDA